jgi:hypothetical protein
MPSNASYIDANPMSPIQLATLLMKLAKNEQDYNQYLAFKNHPLSSEFLQMTTQSYTHPNILCRLCDYAATKNHKG